MEFSFNESFLTYWELLVFSPLLGVNFRFKVGNAVFLKLSGISPVQRNFFYFFRCQESPPESSVLYSESLWIYPLFSFCEFRGFAPRSSAPLCPSLLKFWCSPYLTILYQMHYIWFGSQRQHIVTLPCQIFHYTTNKVNL